MSKTYTSYDELPIMLSVPQLAAVLNISCSSAYALVRSFSSSENRQPDRGSKRQITGPDQ